MSANLFVFVVVCNAIAFGVWKKSIAAGIFFFLLVFSVISAICGFKHGFE